MVDSPGANAAPKLELPVHWVDSDTTLATLCRRWHEQDMLAVDTEFMRSQTYYPLPALIQVNDGAGNYLIDPTAITDFAPLQAVLTDLSVTKVLHSCSEDLEVFQTLLGTVPEPIFDTQVAAALLGYGFSMGYANLVNTILQVELPKGETRSDWLQRPLSRAQTLYAAIDVEYLQIVAQKLRDQLEELNRLTWLEEDAHQLAVAMRSGQDPEQFYLRIKSAWKLTRRELAILRKLAAWREATAQRRNVPRNRVVKEHVLFSLAKDKPRHVGELRKYEGMTERVIRADGENLITLIAEAQTGDEASWPQRLPKPLSPEQGNTLKRLKARVQAMAEQLNLAPEALLRKKDYEVLVRSAAEATAQGQDLNVSQHLHGWRRQVLEEAVLEILAADEVEQQQASAGADPDAETLAEPDAPVATAAVSDIKMLCHVYRSSKKPDMYLYVAKGEALENLPEALMQQFGRPELAMTLLLTPERKLARANVAQVIDALQDKGFYLQMPPAVDGYMQDVNVHNSKMVKR